MEIGNVTLEIRRSGEHATLLLQTRPFGNEIPITLSVDDWPSMPGKSRRTGGPSSKKRTVHTNYHEGEHHGYKRGRHRIDRVSTFCWRSGEIGTGGHHE